MHITVLGAGSWGSALAICFSGKHSVTLWTRHAEHAQDMRQSRINTRYLPNRPFPLSIEIVADLQQALYQAELVLIATPISGLRSTLQDLVKLGSKAPVIWTCKGLEPQTQLLPHSIAKAELPANQHFGMLSGPTFAIEVAQGLPAAATLAAMDSHFAQFMAQQLHNKALRLYSSTDIVGVEVGAAVKNIIAIAAGISDGLKLGNNARSALLTRGMAEIMRLGTALGAIPATFIGLSGIGDLILTATSDLSRNRRVGLMLAQGNKLENILDSLGQVAEGVSTTREVMHKAQSLGIDMPITSAVYQILFMHSTADEMIEQLMGREQKAE